MDLLRVVSRKSLCCSDYFLLFCQVSSIPYRSPKRQSVEGACLRWCGIGRCALRDGVVCRKARVVGVGWSAWHPTALSLLSHPPLFPFSHFRRFPSRLWRTPRTLSPCTSKYSCRVALQYLDSQCLTRMSCLPRHAGYSLNWLWFRSLCVTMIFGY